MYEFNFCRRCGAKLINQVDHIYKCESGHTIYANGSPAVALLLFNQEGEVAILTRSINPGIGKLDFPGGFCDGAEPVDEAVAREVKEEIGVHSDQYTDLRFLHSGIDQYDHEGEVLPVISVIFQADTKEEISLQANDDAATAEFRAISDINREDIFFDSLKAAFDKIVEEKS